MSYVHGKAAWCVLLGLAAVGCVRPPGPPGLEDPSSLGIVDSLTGKPKVNIQVVKEGTGRAAVEGDTVLVHYRGKLLNGEEFDSSFNHGDGKPATFVLQKGKLIAGFLEGLVGMKAGEERNLTIHPELGYGKRGQPPQIPGDAVLKFNVQLQAIK